MAENKSPRAHKEEEVLKFWEENKIFEKTLEKESPKGDFIFYEGPPTANAKPALHHMAARFFKDAIPRYKTMQGYRVPRKAGWDTHGLPVELQLEKKLGFKSKKDIEEFGIEKFNKECKESVFEYIGDWEKFTNRIGYWVNLDEAYYTFDNSYIEKVWEVISHVNDRGLLYKDYKVVPWCPRCGTGLSSHELAQGYKDVKDLSVYAKFKIVDEENSYLLAWTTTPWTLPGNVALAVGENIDYVEITNKKQPTTDKFIIAKSRLGILGDEYEIVRELKGKDLLGLSYEPLYPYLQNNLPESEKPKLEKAYKVYPADFVTTDEGTGIVHTAVMYGQDDFILGTEIGLPKYHLVDDTGHFKPEVETFVGKFVKDEDTAVEIIKDLAHRGLLFRKEKHEHSYPFCWRCQTPLIYYARDSWYIRMSDLREDLVKENEKINWEPDYIKEGRFGEWLKEVKDWAISRERYWGTPLPVWQNSDGTKKYVISSIEDLKKNIKTNKNKFIFVRHGEAEHNVNNICSSTIEDEYHLTEKGKEEAQLAASQIKKADAIYVSPFIRTKETAEIIAENINFEKEKFIFDNRLVDYNFGDFNGKSYLDYLEYDKKHLTTYETKIPGGESFLDAKKRFGEFLYEIDSKHSNQTIVVVTHGIGVETSPAVVEGADMKKSYEIISTIDVPTGKVLEFDFIPLPHNENYELDLHKPYIDKITLEKDGEELVRAKEVMDVWLDSGSMPFASFDEIQGGPFDFAQGKSFDKAQDRQYPADFISEAIDQTRGWFYTLHAVGVLMEEGRAFKNVICLGHLLDKEGRKMSKSVGNVVNPWEMIDKYGVDLLRLWMYSVNQPGESKNFDEKTVEELGRKTLNLLDNTYTFYNLYRDKTLETNDLPKSSNPLDLWILARLTDVLSEATESLDNYKLLEPVRGLREFLDDFSTWFVRRSRDRIKEGDKDAKQTMYFVLKTFVKILAPFAPFTAEDLYQNLKTKEDPESVHLESWPQLALENEDVLVKMEHTRRIVSEALEARSKANIKIRQPLQSLRANLEGAYPELIKDEVNVKIVEDKEGDMFLDTNLTPELIEEGLVREEIRSIQDLRKEKGLKPGELLNISVPIEKKDLYQKFEKEIKRATNVKF